MKCNIPKIKKGEHIIGSVSDWGKYAPPKKSEHWKEGRSAMELAKAWFPDNGPCVPDEFASLLLSRSDLADLQLGEGIPERVTTLPERGQGRNHDLWLLGELKGDRKVTICVEAKADESFGNYTVAGYRRKAEQGVMPDGRTGVPKRISTLIESTGIGEEHWEDIRYQLLTALCGTILQAKEDGSSIAVFVVHELRTHKTAEKYLRKNKEHYAAFLSALGIPPCDQKEGVLVPIKIPGMRCYVGKAVRYYPQ
jgi:hypothetical protein